MNGRGAARTLAHGWASDGRKWTMATTSVLATTLFILLGTAGILDGTTERTLAQVEDFYTGDLRITPSRPGAVPSDWFPPEAAADLAAAGAVAAARVEGQYILSRRSFADAYANEQEGVPVGVPGSKADPKTVVTQGALVGLEEDDPGLDALRPHLVAGRLPRASADGTVEVAMSESRALALLTETERRVPGSLLDVVGSFRLDITSAHVKTEGAARTLIVADAKVVGLYRTGVDMLDAFTLVAAAPDVRALLGEERASSLHNVLAVQSGADQAIGVARGKGWATQDARSFADDFVGQMIGVLQASAWLVAGILFVLPTALVGHGLARQMASQSRELAVATAIGVPRRTLADALALQVLSMAAWACGAAALATLALWAVAPYLFPLVPSPLPLAFAVTGRALLLAGLVTVLSVGVGLWVGMRSRMRLPLASALRAS